MRATIRDVARAAAVSPSTVSRALTVPELVNAATRLRVQEAAERLGYRPSHAARGLSTGRTANLGVVVPDLSNPFFARLAKGVQARAALSDHAVFVADSDEDPLAEARLVRRLAPDVDGLVLCSPRAAAGELQAAVAGTPYVVVHRGLAGAPTVLLDLSDAMAQVAAHLSALGHLRVAYVGGPRRSWSDGEKRRSLGEAAARVGVEFVDLGHVAPQVEGGIAAADLVVSAGVTAVVAYNDVVALGILHRLAARGVAVPADVSVVGCDDIPMAVLAHPQLTTVGMPMQRAGQAAVDLLLEVTAEPGQAAVTRTLPTQLVVRGSTAAARS